MSWPSQFLENRAEKAHISRKLDKWGHSWRDPLILLKSKLLQSFYQLVATYPRGLITLWQLRVLTIGAVLSDCTTAEEFR